MATVTCTTKIVHYASLVRHGEERYGTAERTNGGYLFRPEDTAHKAILVDYRNVDLFLYGVVSIAHQQWVLDEAQGGLVARCAKTLGALITTAVLAVGLLAGSVDAKPRPAPAAEVQEVAIVGTDAREYGVLILLNETLPVRAVIDTGATSVYLPYEVYQRLAATGTILMTDVLPKMPYTVVGGQTFTAHRVLVTLTLGAYRIANVEATIGTTGGDILIGTAVLQRFQSFGIDHTRRILRLGQPR